MKGTKRKKSTKYRVVSNGTLNLPTKLIMEETKIVLGVDPGTRNCGVSVVEFSIKYKYSRDLRTFEYVSHSAKLLYNAKLQNPISDMKELSDQANSFYYEVYSLLFAFNVDAISVERFQARGLRGTVSECVNAMIGILSRMPTTHFRLPASLTNWKRFQESKFMRVQAITPASWKNEYNKRKSLDTLYSRGKSVKVSPHEIDAVCIALYSIRKYYLLTYRLDNLLRVPIYKIIKQYTEEKARYERILTIWKSRRIFT